MSQQEEAGPERDAPAAAAPAAADAEFDGTVFKAVMRKLAGTVCVIGTSDEEGLHGLTATAVCSVSAEPPTVLIVVNRSSRTHPRIDAKQAFTVNLLSEPQRHVAELFASRTRDRFSMIPHRRLADGCPVIDGAAAFLHCSVVQQMEVGTHTIFVGQVIDGGADAPRPLVWHDAGFWTLVPAEEA